MPSGFGAHVRHRHIIHLLEASAVPLTRKQIAQKLLLNPGTVSNDVRMLVQRGRILFAGRAQLGNGAPSNLYTVEGKGS